MILDLQKTNPKLENSHLSSTQLIRLLIFYINNGTFVIINEQVLIHYLN